MSKAKSVFLTILKCLALALALLILAGVIATLPFYKGKNIRVPYSGDTSKSVLVDEKNLFNKSQQEDIDSILKLYSEELEMNIIVFTAGNARSDSATHDFAANTYDSMMGAEYTDGVFLYLDFSNKRPAYDVLSCSGKAGIIYGKRIDDILDSTGTYLPKSGTKIDPDNIVKAIKQFCASLSHYNKDYKPNALAYEKDEVTDVYFFKSGDEFYVTKEKAPGSRFIRLLISFYGGALAGVLIYLITKSRYKFKNSANPSVYVARDKTDFIEKSDTFIRTYTTKTKIQSSSGGGHGGGHHSGGHISGGRHR